MFRSLSLGVGVSVPAAARPSRHLLYPACILLLLASGLLAWAVLIRPADAATVPFPPYVYVVVSGPSSYDVMRNAGGKETRLQRVAVSGVGLSDVAARSALDGQHVAVRVAGDRVGGSSLRLIDVQTSRTITVTLSRSPAVGIAGFAWSPDSRTLAYTVATPQRDDIESGAGALWVVGADARGAHPLGGTGPARLIGWSPDSSGLYYARDDAHAGTADLWFVPLKGSPSPVLRSSPGALQYTLFAVSSAPVLSGTAGAARVAALASGDLATLPAPGALPANVPRSRPAPRIASAAAPGVLAGDGLGGYQALRDSGEGYQLLAWDATGTHLLFSGGKSGAAWYADANTGVRWRLPASLNTLAPLAWSPDGRYLLLADGLGAATRLVTLDTTTGGIVRTRYVGQAPKASTPTKDLLVPYVNQIWHTGTAFNGNWACGPTTVDMVLAYYGRLTPWPFPADQVRVSALDRLSAHLAGAESGKLDLLDGHLYGRYVTAPFSYNGHDFTSWGTDPAGHRVQGLYGTIVGTLTLARWEQMISVLNLYSISTDYIPATWSSITAMLDKGYPVVLGTTLTPSGHILVVRGYTANGYLIVNDPYGNRFGPNGYGAPDGADVAYAWKKIPAKLAMVARGTITPIIVPVPTPAPGAPPAAGVTPAPRTVTGGAVADPGFKP